MGLTNGAQTLWIGYDPEDALDVVARPGSTEGNDDPASWCDSTPEYGNCDPAEHGTPKAPNHDCKAEGECFEDGRYRAIVHPSLGDLVLSELLANPDEMSAVANDDPTKWCLDDGTPGAPNEVQCIGPDECIDPEDQEPRAVVHPSLGQVEFTASDIVDVLGVRRRRAGGTSVPNSSSRGRMRTARGRFDLGRVLEARRSLRGRAGSRGSASEGELELARRRGPRKGLGLSQLWQGRGGGRGPSPTSASTRATASGSLATFTNFMAPRLGQLERWIDSLPRALARLARAGPGRGRRARHRARRATGRVARARSETLVCPPGLGDIRGGRRPEHR